MELSDSNTDSFENRSDDITGLDFSSLAHFVVDESNVNLQSLSQVIYPKFNVHNGTAKIIGCRLELKPILKVDLDSSSQECLYFADNGILGHEIVDSLNLIQAKRLETTETLRRTDHAALSTNDVLLDLQEYVRHKKVIVSASNLKIYWCKFVEGKLSFEFGQRRESLSFGGWGQRLVAGLENCPPYFCDLVNESCYEIGIDDENDICCYSSIQNCDVSNRRLAKTKLDRCSVSGKMVKHEFLWNCLETENRLIKDYAIECQMCQQLVAPSALSAHGVCCVCRKVSRMHRNAPWVTLAKKAFPFVANWRSWKGAEGNGFVVVVGRRFFRKWLFVFDKESKEVIQRRSGILFSRKWETKA